MNYAEWTGIVGAIPPAGSLVLVGLMLKANDSDEPIKDHNRTLRHTAELEIEIYGKIMSPSLEDRCVSPGPSATSAAAATTYSQPTCAICALPAASH